MPLTLEDAASAAAGAAQGGFDLQTANTLFWKQVPLLLRQGDREDQNEELTFRILTGTMRGNHNMRVRRRLQQQSPWVAGRARAQQEQPGPSYLVHALLSAGPENTHLQRLRPLLPALLGGQRGGISEPQERAGHPRGFRQLSYENHHTP